jgi:RNA polymerase sigma-70 factor (ECF subfamily)
VPYVSPGWGIARTQAIDEDLVFDYARRVLAALGFNKDRTSTLLNLQTPVSSTVQPACRDEIRRRGAMWMTLVGSVSLAMPATGGTAARKEPATVDQRADLAELVRAAAGGDESAFRSLYREVQPGLLRYLRGMVGQDAEDIASEAWLQIARDIGSYRGEGGGFRGWAATIARNRALDHLRYRHRRPSVPAAAEHFADLAGFDDTESRAMEAVAMHAAIEWIATLPRDQAEAILLRVVVGLDAQTAADVLGKRAGAVRTAAYRGLRRLAEQLERAPEAGLPSAASGSSLRSWSLGVTRPRPATPEGEK